MPPMTPKGPNPLITDPNSPYFTELSNLGARWVTTGLAGDAQTFSGRGYDQYFIDTNFQDKIDIAVGDFVLLGNRSGVVTAVNLNDDEDKVISIAVREDMKYLPNDYRENPEAYGYTESGFDREIIYILDPTAETEGIQYAKGFLFIGNLLVMKQRTNDPATWGKYANDVILAQNEGQPTLYKIGPLNPGADNCEVLEADQIGDDTIAFIAFAEKEDASELVAGDILYTSHTRVIRVPDGLYYDQATETFVNIVDGVVAALPDCE